MTRSTLVKIPPYAKRAASQALKLRRMLPESKRFGLSEAEARKQGVMSGVRRAKYLLNNKYISLTELSRVASFYNRFKNMRGARAEGAIKLWGGRQFGRYAIKMIKILK